MDIKVDKTCEITLKEAKEIMKQCGVVSEGDHFFSMSRVQLLDGSSQDYVFQFNSFSGEPFSIYSLAEFKAYCDGLPLYHCVLPLCPEAAVEAMRNGKVVKDCNDNYKVRYFIREIEHPYHGSLERIFSFEEDNRWDVAIDCTVAEFLACNDNWYEVIDDSCQGGEE